MSEELTRKERWVYRQLEIEANRDRVIPQWTEQPLQGWEAVLMKSRNWL